MNAAGERGAHRASIDATLHLHVAIKFMEALFWKLIKDSDGR